MDANDRIGQFKKMTESDPDNEMGHFSLGKAYFDEGCFTDCVASFERVLELNPTHSKSHQLLGHAKLELGQRDDAVALLKRGYEIAAEKGDVMPRDGCAKLLTELGEALPEVAGVEASEESSSSQGAGDAGGFRCTRCGRPGGKLPKQPFKGELGERVWARICSDCWRDWIGMGTKVINEMGLALADPRAQHLYDEHMKEFLQIE